MNATKELLTFIIAKELEYQHFAETCEESEREYHESISIFCRNLYGYLADKESYQEERDSLRNYWEAAQEELKARTE